VDRLEAMNAFVTVAELRGFAAAARRLRVSPSAVTRLIAALEEHLSIRLLHRTTRAVAVTDAGARYLERARRILADVGEAEAAARAEHAAPSGRLAISAPVVFGRREVAPLVSDFLARYPAVIGELTLTDRMVDLVDEGVDVAIRIGALDDSSLRVRAVGATRRVLVASPRYLARHGRPRAPEELAAHATIQFTSMAPGAEWRFERRGREIRVAVRPSFATNSADAAIRHATRGAGIARVLSYQVARLVAARRLEVLLPGFEPPVLPIQVVHAAARQPSAALRAFIEMAAARAWRYVDL
jgi:DNA-binding transcriptional LysR family regulator